MTDKKLTKKLQVYVTAEDFELVTQFAAADHRDRGEWVRIELEKFLKKNAEPAAKRTFQLVEV